LTKTADDTSPGIGQIVTYTLNLTNSGPGAATNVDVEDTLPAEVSFVDATPQAGTSYLAGVWTIPSLPSGSTVTLLIRVTVDEVGALVNTAEVTASDQLDADSTPDNHDPNEDDQASVTVNALFDPPSGRKVLSAENLPELEWRMVWINTGNNAAINVQITDRIPYNTTYSAGSLTCEARGSSSTTTCVYDSVTEHVFWQGVIGPDLGAIDEATATNEVVITFRVSVPTGVTYVVNRGTSLTDTDGDEEFVDETTPISVSVSNRATWGEPIAPLPLLSLAGLVVALGLLGLVAFLGLRRARRI